MLGRLEGGFGGESLLEKEVGGRWDGMGGGWFAEGESVTIYGLQCRFFSDMRCFDSHISILASPQTAL